MSGENYNRLLLISTSFTLSNIFRSPILPQVHFSFAYLHFLIKLNQKRCYTSCHFTHTRKLKNVFKVSYFTAAHSIWFEK